MPESWCNALMKYKYEVNLANYPNAQKFPIYFNQHISGDRDSTINFEYYFRKKCSIEIEPWFEVVFWKMYSQGKFIRDSQTNTIIQRFFNKVSPSSLLEAAKKFMECKNNEEAKRAFILYQKKFYAGDSIATVATFPSFLDPQNFPMVDTRVAKWVTIYYSKFNSFTNDEPKLIPSPSAEATKPSDLNEKWKFNLNINSDFEFYWRWILWTREYAQKLNTYNTGFTWRSRDVEMAVFTEGWNRSKLNPL